MLALTFGTAIFRFFRVWRQAEPPPLRPGSLGYRRAQAEAAESGEAGEAGEATPAADRKAHESHRPGRGAQAGPGRRRHRSPR
jgi:hypothetical protein